MTKKISNKNEIPKLKSREFKYIRANAGVSQQKFAYFMGRRSKGTIGNWESKMYMKPYQVDGLIRMVGRELFDSCRRNWADWQEEIKRDTENHMKKYMKSSAQKKK